MIQTKLPLQYTDTNDLCSKLESTTNLDVGRRMVNPRHFVTNTHLNKADIDFLVQYHTCGCPGGSQPGHQQV